MAELDKELAGMDEKGNGSNEAIKENDDAKMDTECNQDDSQDSDNQVQENPDSIILPIMLSHLPTESWTHHSLALASSIKSTPTSQYTDLQEATTASDNDKTRTDMKDYEIDCELAQSRHVLEILRDEPVMLGVDEAGRGPVMGPMVYATAFAPISRMKDIKDIGVDDSKKLNEATRDSLFMSLHKASQEYMGWAVRSISPAEISAGMLQQATINLNTQAHETTIQLIKDTLRKGINVREVYVDTVGRVETYQPILERAFPGIKITVATKADSKYPIVSAASIFAKVIRDSMIKNWRFIEGECLTQSMSREFGSGYPSDPNTKEWLDDHFDPVFGYPNLIRFSWSTVSKRLDEKGIRIIWNDQELEEFDKKPVKPNAKITKFFSRSASSSSEKENVDVGVDEEAEEGKDEDVDEEEEEDEEEEDDNNNSSRKTMAGKRRVNSASVAAVKGNKKRKTVTEKTTFQQRQQEIEQRSHVQEMKRIRKGNGNKLQCDSLNNNNVMRHVSIL